MRSVRDFLSKAKVSRELQTAIESFGFAGLTPVQQQTIPELLNRKDVVVQAVTGSGKTIAFLIPLFELLIRKRPWKKHEVGAVIIVPTRELAVQIARVFDQIQKYVKDVNRVLLIGGNPIEKDVRLLREKHCNVLICTPGRLEDLLEREIDLHLANSLKSLELLIIDEADRLLDYGFAHTMDSILPYMPKQRRTGLFSATQTKEVEELIRAGLRDPTTICIRETEDVSTPARLQNYYMLTTASGKIASVIAFIKAKKMRKAMIFMLTCAAVDYWSTVLPHFVPHLKIMALHGQMKSKRTKIFSEFMDTDNAILLCTDVLARGIDVPEVDWVLQVDPPTSASAFVHRIGRTARQGRQGASIIFLLANEDAYINFLQINQKVKFEQLENWSTNENHALDLMNTLRHLQLKNRTIMMKAIRAYVSYVRAYSKQECFLLLRTKDLPLVQIAMSYGLLYLPRMPELKNRSDLGEFPTIANFDSNSVPFANKKQEELRQQKLAKLATKAGAEAAIGDGDETSADGGGRKRKKSKGQTESWSLKKKAKLDAKMKRERSQNKKQ